MNFSSRAIVGLVMVPVAALGQAIDLPTSKQIVRPVPGSPQRLNSLPMSMAVSPDARYVVTVNAGYGTFESNYMQSLAVLDTQTGAVADFPEAERKNARSRHCTRGLLSAGTEDISTRAWGRRPILWGRRAAIRAAVWWCMGSMGGRLSDND